jgi:hypothetical protein
VQELFPAQAIAAQRQGEDPAKALGEKLAALTKRLERSFS